MGKKLDALGDRMKKYENINRTYLTPRTPVIIRLDGKAFHTFTRWFNKPFDEVLVRTMQETMKYLCENVQGCVLGYAQSDEITLVLIDYKQLNTCAWFDYNIQKCVSVASSMATLAFNKFFRGEIQKFDERNGLPNFAYFNNPNNHVAKLHDAYWRAHSNGAMFDARCFNIPKEEVTNCILWRQNDATRNSIEMVGQANFSHAALLGKSCNQIQDMLFTEKGINWNDFPAHLKRGSCCIRRHEDGELRPKWVIDKEIPIFNGDGRKYIDDLIFVGE